MKVIILYESFFGNTRKVAEAIYASLSSRCEVHLHEISSFDPESLRSCDMLIVGSPTRAFRPTPGIMACLRRIPASALTSLYIATFDTRISENSVNSFLRMMMKWFGYASKPLSTFLRSKGGLPLSAPEGFIVNGTEGPLPDSELRRAGTWGNHLIDLLIEKRKL